MLEVKDLKASIGENRVLRGISLEVPQGSSVAVLGANGAGKSSLIRTITGLLKATSGKVLLNGEEIQNQPPHVISRLGVAVVPEGRRMFADMNVQDNLMMGAFLPRGRKMLDQTMEEVLSLFPVLKERLDQRAGTLSGGEQQMLSIGRALMSRPVLLILDELSLGLAPVIVQEIYRVLEKVRQRTTMLLVEQSVEMALRNTSYAYLLETGSLSRQGASADLLADPGLKEAYLGL
ncbi:ABC transporter ATP-binding protein [Dethiosulfatarculus sandiegensis]|uniref:Amino acid ABC transporter ATPase n=1 Tax=Dethiosulfatarculus sandiegensis TaxID=1429043 RepID=A0A0D2JBN3_9BACT|nr:ABC transporter ATP-binding protein [Dethiosulfatarculus sandiegensis]KIX15524.1 amino acid ABC transporter ATPase [Dethiosulfatarculus sandiegensis]